MAMQCPTCGSTHIQPHSVIHADGTQHFQASHTAVTSDGRFVQGSSQGSQTSRLAQHCAPPPPPSPMPFVGAYGLGGFVLYWAMTTCDLFEQGCRQDMSILGHLLHNWKQACIGLGIIAVGWLLMKGWHVQAQDYNRAKHQWQNTWMCHTCGQSHTRV